jgi:hypothetical protein
MGGRDDAGRLLHGEQFREAGHRLRPATAVQQQEGAALAAVVGGDVERAGAGRGEAERARGQCSS